MQLQRESLGVKVLRTIIVRWLVSYAVFVTVYRANLVFFYVARMGYFDPSGHMMCALLSYSCWALIIQFVSDVTSLADRPAA